MNFLAHIYLSGNHEKIMVGNFIGDFVKGKNALEKFDPIIIKGIELHRAIDEFTDNHEIVARSKNRLRPKYRHYSGVIVDVFYDHFLAAYWNQYHQTDLVNFASDTYTTIEKYSAILPESVKQMLPYMMRGNWLLNYSKPDGINRALTGMSRRTPYESKMDEAVHDLQKHYQDFHEEFRQFFPLLDTHCRLWLNDHIGSHD